MMLPRLPDAPLSRLPLPPLPLHDVRQAVERDVRGLWAGMDALLLNDVPAANEPTFAPKLEAVMQRGWRLPLGWVSLAAAAAFLAALGFAQMQFQRHLAPTVKAESQQARTATRKQKHLRRARPLDRTDYSSGP